MCKDNDIKQGNLPPFYTTQVMKINPQGTMSISYRNFLICIKQNIVILNAVKDLCPGTLK